jgi:hypothetical protein
MTGNQTIKIALSLLMIPALLCLLLAACTPKESETEAGQGFIKIYDRSDTLTYTAVDIKQTGDGGYIILGLVKGRPYLLRVDWQGDFLWESGVETFRDYKEPVPGILILDQGYYFFCEYNTGAQFPLRLIKFTEESRRPEPVELHLDDIPFQPREVSRVVPLHASPTPDDKILLLAASDLLGHEILLIKIDGSGSKENWQIYRNVYDCYVQYPLTDRRFHFSGAIDNADNAAYFQTYSSHLAYPSDRPCFWTGRITPGSSLPDTYFYLHKPFVAMEWYDNEPGNSRFSGARIDSDTVSFFINFPLEGVDGETGDPQLELDEGKPVYVHTIEINTKKIVFFVGSSKSNEIVLYTYDHLTRNDLDKRYFGGTRLYEAAGLLPTGDGGLAIVGTTYVMDLFGRICLFKLSKADLQDMI